MRRLSTIEGSTNRQTEVDMPTIEPTTEIRPFRVDVPEAKLERRSS
jgi:hypothetical protein